MKEPATDAGQLALVRGLPLDEERSIGALTLGGYLHQLVDRYASREALVFHTEKGVVRWSYRELWEHSEAVARALLACDVGKGTRVGILMTNRPEFLAAVFGTALAGGVATTLSTFSTGEELDFLLQQSACSVLLFEREVLNKDFAAMLETLEPDLATVGAKSRRSARYPFLRQLAALDADTSSTRFEHWQDFLARGETVPPALVEASAASVCSADPGVLFFSSGSTGKPKGILSAHRGVCLQLWRWRHWLNLEDGVRSWSANGFFWSGNFAVGIGGTLSAGGCLVLQATFAPVQALELMATEKVAYLFAWPHQWAQLTDAKNWLEVDLSALRFIDRDSPVAAHPTVNSDWTDPAHAYGNTETFTLSTVYPANTPEEITGASHGVPAAGNTVKIVNPLGGETLNRGERGEIAIKGPTLMLGYLGVPLDETLDKQGFFRTGDGGFIDEHGRLNWEGRLNDIIKTGGANVSPLEIDEVLARCPGVKVARTVGIPDELLGELVVSCVVPMEEALLTAGLVREFARERLASYKVPRQVLIITENDLDMTGSAKVKTQELRELASRILSEAG